MTNRITRQQGFSLVELMIAIVLGMLLLAAATSMFSETMRSNTDTLRSARLNQDLATVMEIMVNDLRRAGYTDQQVAYDDTTLDLSLASVSCVLYSYNRNSDNANGSPDTNIDNAEWFGFKLDDGALWMRNSCSAGAACGTGCDNGNWERITDPNVVAITDFTLSSTGSKCLNLETDNYWITTSDTATDFPCDDDVDSSGLTTFIYDGTTSPPSYAAGTYVAPLTDERLVETRQVNIQLTGNLVANSDFSKQVTGQVKIRNDRVRVAP